MVLKQVTSLNEISLQVLSDKIYKFIKLHCEPCEFCSVCKTEHCSVITPVIQMLDLPKNIIQRVYNKVYLEYKSIFDSNTNLLYLFLSLLRFEHTSLKINDYCFTRYDKDIPFIIKFGKKINSLELKDEPEQSITLDIETGATLCRTLLRSVVNVQVLDFKGIKVTDKLLKVVGIECTQLQVLSGIMIGGLYTTRESFRKLLFCSTETGTERNKCCDTLQAINFYKIQDFCYIPEDSKVELRKIIHLLLQNVTHLKSVGEEFDFGYYFKTFKPDEIHQVKLDDINFYGHLNNHECIVLKDICPTVKKLRIDFMLSGVAQELTSFKCLEEITCTEVQDIVYQEILVQHWANLKIMKLFEPLVLEGDYDLDIDLLIKNFPVLTELYLYVWIDNVNWSRTTHFNCLKKVSFDLVEPYNIFWFASFASTVQSIQFTGNRYPIISSDDCEVFVTVSFPNLEHLCIEDISYDFQFYSSVLAKLPKLEKCFMYDFRETESEKVQKIAELSQFMSENNLQCELDGTSADFFAGYK